MKHVSLTDLRELFRSELGGQIMVAGFIAICIISYILLKRRNAPVQRTPGEPRSKSGSAFNPAFSNAAIKKLEDQLRMAVFDPAARERLIADAMQRQSCDRATAIRVVLEDLDAENKRYH